MDSRLERRSFSEGARKMKKKFKIQIIITYRNTKKEISKKIFKLYFKNEKFYKTIEKIINDILF